MSHTLEDLTPTERSVALLLAEGHNRESIANQLEIRLVTASCHLNRIRKKLEVTYTTEIVVWYYQTYWCPK